MSGKMKYGISGRGYETIGNEDSRFFSHVHSKSGEQLRCKNCVYFINGKCFTKNKIIPSGLVEDCESYREFCNKKTTNENSAEMKYTRSKCDAMHSAGDTSSDIPKQSELTWDTERMLKDKSKIHNVTNAKPAIIEHDKNHILIENATDRQKALILAYRKAYFKARRRIRQILSIKSDDKKESEYLWEKTCIPNRPIHISGTELKMLQICCKGGNREQSEEIIRILGFKI